MVMTITKDKALALQMVRQAQGTLKKIETMIEQDVYCPDILQQLSSVKGTLKHGEMSLLKGHFAHCLEKRLQDSKEQTIEELIHIYKLSI